MRPLAALLDRFRRGVAVPAAFAGDLAGELLPVFASLQAVEEEAAAVRRGAVEEAERILAAAAEEAVRISAGWRHQAETARQRAAAEVSGKARQEAVAILARGQAEAERVRRRARARLPALVAVVVACVEEGPA